MGQSLVNGRRVLELVALGATIASHALGQPCAVDAPRPVVCSLEIVSSSGAVLTGAGQVDRMEIRTGETAPFEVVARDQWGRFFPWDRLGLQAEVAPGCSVLEVTMSSGRLDLEVGSRPGRCRVQIWMPGNMNFDVELDIEVVAAPAPARAYSRTEAALLADWLYQGLLGRPIDPDGAGATEPELLRGDLEGAILRIATSSEFIRTRSRYSNEERLDSLYRGLLGRSLDSVGRRAFLDAMRTEGIQSVALMIATSEELERRLTDVASGAGTPVLRPRRDG